MKKITFILSILIANILFAQYAPAFDIPGSTAIYKDSSIIVAWATSYKDYIVGPEADVVWQTPEAALGKAEGTSFDIVSLGRGGQITLKFDTLIVNGDGPDFVAFENSLNDTFLELAWVEVSYDGKNFIRIPNYSLTSSTVGSFGAVDPTKVTGYCSKYFQGYGTPFDLDSVSLDTIRFVRLVDIVGDGTAFDSNNNVIYDPYPTSGSAGADIDAVGVINAGSGLSTTSNYITSKSIKIYPNPTKDNLQLIMHNVQLDKNTSVYIYDVYGKLISVIASNEARMNWQSQTDSHELRSSYNAINIDVSDLQKGIYFIKIAEISKKFVKM